MILIISFVPKMSFVGYPKLFLLHEIRNTLYEAGLIEKKVPGMFFTEKPALWDNSPKNSNGRTQNKEILSKINKKVKI